MHLNRSGVQTKGFDANAHDLLQLQFMTRCAMAAFNAESTR